MPSKLQIKLLSERSTILLDRNTPRSTESGGPGVQDPAPKDSIEQSDGTQTHITINTDTITNNFDTIST